MERFWQRNQTICLVVGFYFVTSLSLVFLNKHILSGINIPAPIFLTWTQILISVCCCALLGTFGQRYAFFAFFPQFEYNYELAKKIAPLTAVFCAMIILNNLTLMYVEVSFYQVARSLTILFNVTFTYYLLNQKVTMKSMLACTVITIGYLMGTDAEFSERSWSSLGVFYGVCSSAFVSLNAIYVSKILPMLNNNAWRLLMYNNINAAFIFPVISLVAGEGRTVLQSTPKIFSFSMLMLFVLAGLAGFLLNVATFLQIRYTSALTHNVSGTAKACVQTILAVLVYRNHISNRGVLGLILCIGGSFWYTYIRYEEKMIDERKMANKTDDGYSDEEIPLIDESDNV